MFGSTKKKLITHNGAFHADDIFATAALQMMLDVRGEKYEVIRTRDEEIIKTGDYVYDVGGIYDREQNRFDHHQEGGAGQNKHGLEYSSLGLVWEKFGAEVAGGEKEAAIIEARLCAPIDAGDNGQDLVENKYDVGPYYIQSFFGAMVPNWKEEDKNIDEVFLQCVDFARQILTREVEQARAIIEAESAIIDAYQKAPDKRIIVLDKSYPFEYVLINFPEPLYAIYPRKMGVWGAKTIRKDIKSFENRKDFPKAWAGLRDEELQKITGVPDAIFCHRALFMASAKSKEGAIALAKIAVST